MKGDLQRAQALVKANAARSVRSRLRSQMLDGSLTLRSVAAVGAADDDLRVQADRTDVLRLLLWSPGIGRQVAHRILTTAEIAPSSKLADLNADERRRLVVASETLAVPRGATV